MDYLQYHHLLLVCQINLLYYVLNLIINGLPSILNIDDLLIRKNLSVLNLIINGLPSIHK